MISSMDKEIIHPKGTSMTITNSNFIIPISLTPDI